MFDYIIIGAGSAGCVLANRLSSNPDHRVLLLEAGPRDWHPFIHMPAGLAKLVGRKGVNWDYNTEPEPALNNRRLWWPRGKVLGGSSSINAMCYIRGAAGDYDEWAADGARGWDWQSVLPYFRRAEDNERGADQLHGSGGPLGVADLRYHNPLSDQFIAAAQQAGFPPGIFNVVTTAHAPSVGGVLTGDDRVRKISFTGSTQVGRLLMEQSAPQIKKISLELGGNAPFIIFPSADMKAAVEGAMA